MRRKTWSLLLTGVLLASLFQLGTASAAPEVPENPNVVDPEGDTTGGASTVGDILAGWFTHDGDTISAHIQTVAPPPSSIGTIFEMFANPNDDFSAPGNGCIRFLAAIPGSRNGGTLQGEPLVKVYDKCNDGTSTFNNGVEAEYTIDELGDGTGVLTITAPRSYSPMFADGEVLTQPSVVTRQPVGETSGTVGWVQVVLDNTEVGTDYEIRSEDPEPGPTTGPPGKNDPPGKKKGCKKGSPKAKKKGCKKNKNQGKKKGKGKKTPVKACDPYEPGESGAEAETLVVTDEATEEAPLELTVPTSPGVGAGRNPGTFGALVSHAYVNLQVDVSDASGGLWVRLSSADYQDYDLYLDLADGTQVAVSGGFGPEQDGEEGDSHTDFGSETLTGIKTEDCGGYTLDIVGAATQGGDTTLTAWIGDELWDPVAGGPTR